jgi:hypothetical protein
MSRHDDAALKWSGAWAGIELVRQVYGFALSFRVENICYRHLLKWATARIPMLQNAAEQSAQCQLKQCQT